MMTRATLFLARRVLKRVQRIDAAPTVRVAAWHLLCAFPGACIIGLVSIIRPSIRQTLASNSREFVKFV